MRLAKGTRIPLSSEPVTQGTRKAFTDGQRREPLAIARCTCAAYCLWPWRKINLLL